MALSRHGVALALALVLPMVAGSLSFRVTAAELSELDLASVTAASAVDVRPKSQVVIASTQTSEQRNEVMLTQGSQTDSRLLTLSNASAGDTISGVNLYRTDGDASNLPTQLHQSNQLTQTQIIQARAGRFEAPTGSSLRVTTQALKNNQASHTFERIARTNERIQAQTTTTRFQSSVTPQRIGFFDTPVVIASDPIKLPDFFISLPSVGVQFEIGDNWGDLFDLEVDITLNFPASLRVRGAELSPGEIALDGNDIVLTSPRLTLPSLEFGFCFLQALDACSGDGTEATVTLPGQTLALGEITLEGANPLGDLGLELGYAIAGDGTITVDGGSLSLKGEVPIDVGDIANVAFDILVPNAGNVGSVTDNLDLPTFDVPVNVTVDFPEPAGFDRTFTADEGCVFNQSGSQCSPVDTTTTVTNSVNQSVTVSRDQQSSQQTSTARYEVYREEGDLRLKAGQSRLTVLRKSTATESRYSIVVVTDQSQSGALFANGVNSAAAIVGNGLNITTLKAPQGTSSLPITALRQQNQFRQIGGL